MSRWSARTALVVALALLAGATFGGISPARSAGFPKIPAWVLVGAFQDSSTITNESARCVGSFGPRPDSLRASGNAMSLRFLRDRVAEARPDFGGYRIYRMVGSGLAGGGADTTRAVLIRRYSLNIGSEQTWQFSKLDTIAYDIARIDSVHTRTAANVDTVVLDTTFRPHPTYMQYLCDGGVVHDSVVTFVDPDSSGNYVKVCRRRDASGNCLSKGDSIFVLQAPPGPHDGFRTWYAITYEKLNTTDTDYEDLFVPDTLDNFARCTTPGDRTTCPNLNDKLENAVGPSEPTRGPVANLEGVRVVPNPYRGTAPWDLANAHEVHFISLPKHSLIRIYTVAGDLVRELHHDDAVRDFERWDLKSGAGSDVASGIYIYRVEAGTFSYQSRFIIIR